MRSSLDYAGFAQLCARSPIMREIMRAHNRIIQRSLLAGCQWRNYELAGPWTNIQVEPSLPFPCPLSPSASSLLLILPHPFPSSLSLSPTLFFPFPPSPVLITARVRGLGSAIASPAGRPPNAFLCNLQPKNCKSVKSLTHVQMS